MRIVVLFLLLAFCSTTSAQRIRSHSNPDSVAVAQADLNLDAHIYKAGAELRRSANCELMSWGFAAVSAISYYQALHDKSDKTKTVGAICAACALISEVAAVRFKYKSGLEIQLAAGGLNISF